MKEAEEIATSIIVSDPEKNKTKGALRRHHLVNTKVTLDSNNKVTTLREEQHRFAIYDYLLFRAKEKIREVNSAIDLGRSLLSWDRQEADKIGG